MDAVDLAGRIVEWDADLTGAYEAERQCVEENIEPTVRVAAVGGRIDLRKLRAGRALPGTVQSPRSGDYRRLEHVHVESNESRWLSVSRRAVAQTTAGVGVVVDREDVPSIGYSICDERGYLLDVLEPLIEDRDAIKADIRATDDEDRREELEGQSSAIKWILMSCFGYQGFSNAKFGRIECLEAINAFAREILLETKAVLEENGWRIVHGIVDSVWVTPIEGEEQTSLSELVSEISEQVEIRLEHEAHYGFPLFRCVIRMLVC